MFTKNMKRKKVEFWLALSVSLGQLKSLSQISLLFAQLYYCNLKSMQLELIKSSGKELFI